MTEALLWFNGHRHVYERLPFKTSAAITVKAEDICLPDEPYPLVQADEKTQGDYLHGPIIFYKYEGKYVPLRGYQRIREALSAGKTIIAGNLISGPALKSIRRENVSTSFYESRRATHSQPDTERASRTRYLGQRRGA